MRKGLSFANGLQNSKDGEAYALAPVGFAKSQRRSTPIPPPPDGGSQRLGRKGTQHGELRNHGHQVAQGKTRCQSGSKQDSEPDSAAQKDARKARIACRQPDSEGRQPGERDQGDEQPAR